MDYSIRRSSDRCGACAHAFEVHEALYSTVRLESEEPARRDYCVECFQALPRDPSVEFAFWRTRRTADGRARRAIDFNSLRDLFFRMAEQHGDEYRKLCYLLGLVLIRKRFVRLEEFVTEDGRDFLVVSTPHRPEALRLEAPSLMPSEFGELRDKLRALLDIDFEDEGGVSASPAPESTDGRALGAT
jgi:hypothetical protein